MKRRYWVWLHRWAGLYMALFLVVASLTGSVLAFAPELQAWLDPPPKLAVQNLPRLDALVLRERALALTGPTLTVNTAALTTPDGEPYTAWVEPLSRSPGTLSASPGFDFVRLNPYTGEEIERGLWPQLGLWPINRHNLLSVIVAIHYRLAIPGSIGGLLFGTAALIWTIDCFVAIFLTFPVGLGGASGTGEAIKRWPGRWWNPAWLVRLGSSTYRLNFDLHRAGGLWIWILLLALAWSSVGFNLRDSVYVPVMGTLGYTDLVASLPQKPPQTTPGLTWELARNMARKHLADRAARQDFRVLEEDALVYLPDRHAFQYWIRSDRDIIRPSVMTYLLIDANDGRDLGLQLPTGDRPGNTLNTWVSALHMATVWGMPYKIFLALTGLVITMLSVTGIYIWWKKRKARTGRMDIKDAGS